MTLKDRAEKVAREVWGFVPNRAVKPVHFANGFFRALSGRMGNPDLLHKAAGAYLTGKTRTTTEELRHEIADRLDTANGTPTTEQVKTLRTALDLVLSQDRAVFATARNYSFTLTHWKHASSDPSDQRTGRFLAGVLAHCGHAEVINVLRDILDRRDDTVYQLTAPLLDQRKMGPAAELDSEMAEEVTQLVTVAQPLQTVVSSIVCLSRYAPHLEKSAFLHRLVTLGGFGLYLHVVNSTSAAHTGRRVPILLCAPEPSAEVLEASRATFLRAKRQIVHAFEEGFARKLAERGEANLGEAEYRQRMHDWLFAGVNNDTARRRAERLFDQFEEEFAAERAGTDSIPQAFIRAAVSTSFAQIGTRETDNPLYFAAFLGTHTGFIGPFRGPGEKYYRPLPQFLDALVGGLLAPSEEIPLDEFWHRAWQRFGLLTGARSRHDTEQLGRWGVRQASINRLADNATGLTEELARLGYARTYADTATLIRADV